MSHSVVATTQSSLDHSFIYVFIMYVSSLNDLVYLYIKLFIIYFLFLFIESSQKQMKLCIIPNNQKTNLFSSFIFVVVCKI
jgi:hypothetical protein